jgi:hypothetical protein
MIAQSPYIVDSTLLVAIIWDRQLKSGHFVGVQPSEPTTAGYIWRLYASSIMNKEVSRWSASNAIHRQTTERADFQSLLHN